MTCDRASLPATVALMLCCIAVAPTLVWAQAGTISKDMQNNCVNDYKRFCGDYGLQSAALNLCMKKAGPSLDGWPVELIDTAGLREGAGGSRKGVASRRG